MFIGCLGMKSRAKSTENIGTFSLALALDVVPRQSITTDYLCQTIHGDPRGGPGEPGNLKTARGSPLQVALSLVPGPPSLPSGSSLGSLELPQGIYF